LIINLYTTPTTTPVLNEKECPECGHNQKISTDAKRTTCSKCDKPIKLRAITAILATVLLMATVPAIYAEISVIQEDLTPEEQKVLDDIAAAKADGTYIPPPEAKLTADIRVYSGEVTLNVTHPVDYDAIHCYTNFDLFVATTHCILPGFPPDPKDKYFDPDTQTWKPVEELKAEIQEQQQQEIVDSKKTREQLYNEERINYIEQRTKPTKLEVEELELRKSIGALCRSDTAVSQTYREYDVITEVFRNHEGVMQQRLVVDSNPKVDDARDSRFIQSLRNQVQECIAQPYTKKSVQYDHIVVDGLYSKDPNKPVAPDAISANMVNEMQNTDDKTKDLYTIACESYTTKQTRDLYGCPQVKPYDQAVLPTPELQGYEDSDPIKRMQECLDKPTVCLSDSIKFANKDRYDGVKYGGTQ